MLLPILEMPNPTLPSCAALYENQEQLSFAQ